MPLLRGTDGFSHTEKVQVPDVRWHSSWKVTLESVGYPMNVLHQTPFLHQPSTKALIDAGALKMPRI